jgi:hypothetical protein
MRDELAGLGLDIHVGPHTREIVVEGPDTSGVTVNVPNRICSATR